MLGIVTALKKWRAFLYNTTKPFRVVTDYKNLTGFLITKKLNWRQIKWVKKLIKYYFKIKYIKGTKNVRVDIFSKKTEF